LRVPQQEAQARFLSGFLLASALKPCEPVGLALFADFKMGATGAAETWSVRRKSPRPAPANGAGSEVFMKSPDVARFVAN
jgi:hypothetical protein